MARSRPAGVTLVSILAWINGIISIIGGILALIGGLAAIGWITLILGIITVAVGVGLWRGNRAARMIATVVFILDIISAIITLVSVPGNTWSAISSGVLALIGVILLWTRPANDFFRR